MSKQKSKETACTHYWVIASPNGPTSQGVCKLCGERAEFRNSISVSGWDREGSRRRSGG